MARDKVTRTRRLMSPARIQDGTDLGLEAVAVIGSVLWPVGAILLSTVATDPAVLLGFGTWELYGTGRVLVGIDAGCDEFNEPGELGGERRHVLTCAEVPEC